MTAQQQALLNDAARILRLLLTRGEAETWRDAHDWLVAYENETRKPATRKRKTA